MGTDLGHVGAREHDDQVGHADGREPVRDQDGHAPGSGRHARLLGKALEQCVLGLGV